MNLYNISWIVGRMNSLKYYHRTKEILPIKDEYQYKSFTVHGIKNTFC